MALSRRPKNRRGRNGPGSLSTGWLMRWLACPRHRVALQLPGGNDDVDAALEGLAATVELFEGRLDLVAVDVEDPDAGAEPAGLERF